MNKKTIKVSYYILLVLISTFVLLYTIFDITKYGGVMKNNLQMYAVALVIPLFHSLKQKIYEGRMQKFLYLTFLVIIIFSVFTVPKYTYKEAAASLEDKVTGKYIKESITSTDETSFFYRGNYRINIGEVIYSYSIKDHSYHIIVSD